MVMVARSKTSGIYSITNSINGHRYLGSSCEIEVRWTRHRRELTAGKHHSAYLQRAWELYGEQNFVFEIVEFCNPACLLNREQWYLINTDHSYNLAQIAGAPPPTETPILVLDPATHETLLRYRSVSSAEVDGYNAASIADVCKGRRNTYAGFEWRFESHHGHERPWTCKPVAAVDSTGQIVKVYQKLRDVLRDGFEPGNVSAVCHGRGRKRHKKFYWKFI